VSAVGPRKGDRVRLVRWSFDADQGGWTPEYVDGIFLGRTADLWWVHVAGVDDAYRRSDWAIDSETEQVPS